MKLAAMSDLHFEFHRDGGLSFLRELNSEISKCTADKPDGIILAGDIDDSHNIRATLGEFCKIYKHVFYVLGNHEYYGCPASKVYNAIELACKENPNLHWLDNSSVVVDGVRIIGTTLWFQPSEATCGKEKLLGDYAMIPHFDAWVGQKHQDAILFLENQMFYSDIVITHHLPSYKSIAEKFQNNILNPFFANRLDNLICSAMPQVVVSGHTHASTDYKLGATRMVGNPFGYVGIDENEAFSWNKIIEVKGKHT